MRPLESFIEQPVRSLQTMLRIIAEDDNSIPTIVPDGIYGQDTIASVIAFQRKYKIPITGIADQITWDQIVKIYENAIIQIDKAEPIEIIIDPGVVFKQGDKNPYIYLLQSILIQLSNDAYSIQKPSHTGIFDYDTVIALKEFQRLSDLPQTGQLDRITWKHLSKQFTLSAHHEKIFENFV